MICPKAAWKYVPCRHIFQTKDCALGEKAKKVVQEIDCVSSVSRDSNGNHVDGPSAAGAVGNVQGLPYAVDNDHGPPNDADNDESPSLDSCYHYWRWRKLCRCV